MNDLPQNELLSAYLDGELNAAERAEVERLLAASPAARQLLEELRTLSSTLRALPREKLGEDLSRQVLRTAERRMLTEGGPGETECGPTAPVPLGWSTFRRFVNRRTMTWVGLTVVIAVLIRINELRQGAGPAADGAKQLARAKSEQPAEKTLQPSSIRAAPDSSVLFEDRDKAARPAAPAASAAKPTVDGFGYGGKAAAKEPAGAKPSAPLPSKAVMSRVLKKDGQTAVQADMVAKDEQTADGVLVVHCDISPEAAKKQAFENLLMANGIAWQQSSDRKHLGNEAKEKAPARKEPAPAVQNLVWRSMAAGERNSIYVEATPEQIEATLAGLAAQPKMFVSFSQKSAEGESLRELVAPYSGSGQTAGSAVGGMGQRFQAKSAVGVSAKQSAAGESGADLMTPVQSGVEQQRPMNAPAAQAQQQVRSKKAQQAQQLNQAASRQRALFVLRIVGDDQPSAVKTPVQSK